jgi:hypothetical protein
MQERVMFKKSLAVVFTSLVVLGDGGTARAQFMDLSHIVQANMNFDQQAHQWAWQASLAAAKWHRETGTPIPFNAMTIAAANRQTQQVYDSANSQWHNNSNRVSQAISNWTNGAIRGVGPYQAPNGQLYMLPWTHNQYHMNQYGQFVPGHNPYGTNVLPYHGR